jgi:hypothetical protein
MNIIKESTINVDKVSPFDVFYLQKLRQAGNNLLKQVVMIHSPLASPTSLKKKTEKRHKQYKKKKEKGKKK